MNRQRFLAELQRLLVFMTEEDKSTVIRCYSEMFDAVGPEGEEALLLELGSPTKAAIGVSRGYEPGNIKNLPDLEKLPAAPVPEKAAPVSFPDIPTLDLPSLGEEDTGEPKAEDSAEEPQEAPPQTTDAPVLSPEQPVEKPVSPPVIGIPLFTLLMLVPGLPLACLTVAFMAVFLVPGGAALLGAFLVGVGALWCVGFMADAILMAGCTFLVLALGVFLLWLGIWAGIKLCSHYVAAVRLIYAGRWERKRTTMRKAWRVVGILVLVFLLLGLIGVGVGFFTGSSPVTIQDHGCLVPYLERLEINRDILWDGAQSLLISLGL